MPDSTTHDVTTSADIDLSNPWASKHFFLASGSTANIFKQKSCHSAISKVSFSVKGNRYQEPGVQTLRLQKILALPSSIFQSICNSTPFPLFCFHLQISTMSHSRLVCNSPGTQRCNTQWRKRECCIMVRLTSK